MFKDDYIQAVNKRNFSENMEEQIYHRISEEKKRRKRLKATIMFSILSIVFLFACIQSTSFFNITSYDKENHTTKEYTVSKDIYVTEELYAGEKLVIHVETDSDKDRTLNISGNMQGNQIKYEIGYMVDNTYQPIDKENTDTDLNQTITIKKNKEYQLCIINLSSNSLNFSGKISVKNQDLVYREYGDDSFKIIAPSNLSVENVSSIIEDNLEGIILYNCKTYEIREIALETDTISIDITEPGNYMLYAITTSGERINLKDYIGISSISTINGSSILPL